MTPPTARGVHPTAWEDQTGTGQAGQSEKDGRLAASSHFTASPPSEEGPCGQGQSSWSCGNEGNSDLSTTYGTAAATEVHGGCPVKDQERSGTGRWPEEADTAADLAASPDTTPTTHSDSHPPKEEAAGGGCGEDGSSADPAGPPSSKPPYSYVALITMALQSAPSGMMTLSQIYAFIADRFPYFQEHQKRWQNSIRHNLSLNDCFVRRSRYGKGGLWMLHPACGDMFAGGTYLRRTKKFQTVKARTVPSDCGGYMDNYGRYSPYGNTAPYSHCYRLPSFSQWSGCGNETSSVASPQNEINGLISQQPETYAVVSQQCDNSALANQQKDSYALTSQQKESYALTSQQKESYAFTSQQKESYAFTSQQDDSCALASQHKASYTLASHQEQSYTMASHQTESYTLASHQKDSPTVASHQEQNYAMSSQQKESYVMTSCQDESHTAASQPGRSQMGNESYRSTLVSAHPNNTTDVKPSQFLSRSPLDSAAPTLSFNYAGYFNLFPPDQPSSVGVDVSRGSCYPYPLATEAQAPPDCYRVDMNPLAGYREAHGTFHQPSFHPPFSSCSSQYSHTALPSFL